jgi:hypothetical protein
VGPSPDGRPSPGGGSSSDGRSSSDGPPCSSLPGARSRTSRKTVTSARVGRMNRRMNRSGAIHHGDPPALSRIEARITARIEASTEVGEPGARSDVPAGIIAAAADDADSGATASPRAAARTPMRADTSLNSTGVEATQSPCRQWLTTILRSAGCRVTLRYAWLPRASGMLRLFGLPPTPPSMTTLPPRVEGACVTKSSCAGTKRPWEAPVGRARYSTVQLEPERNRALMSPRPRFSCESTICSDICVPYSGRSTARKTPMGVGS